MVGNDEATGRGFLDRCASDAFDAVELYIPSVPHKSSEIRRLLADRRMLLVGRLSPKVQRRVII